MAKSSDSNLPSRDGYSQAETRIITDVFGFVHNKDPDGRIQKALESWLGVDVKLEVLSAMIEGTSVEAEIHLGEAKVYLKLNALDEGDGDWIEKYVVEEVKTPCSPKILKAVAKLLKKADVPFDKIFAATSSTATRNIAAKNSAAAALSQNTESVSQSVQEWQVIFGLDSSLKCGMLTSSTKGKDLFQSGVRDGEACRRLASQLIAQTGRTLATQMGPEAEMELFAKILSRKSENLIEKKNASDEDEDGNEMHCLTAHGIFADVSVSVCFSKQGSVDVKVES
ncbi:MAG: hypothetical protein GY822_00965 [Deltaproteobacteria bacterium]|nr:hypothetical protein [Deltaproteobacteria bacterium]